MNASIAWLDPCRDDGAQREAQRVVAWERRGQPLGGAALIRRSFSVAGEPRERQLPAWRDRLADMLDVPVTQAQLAMGFRGELESYELPDLVYLDSRTDPLPLRRSAQRIAADRMRDYCFHVMVEGIAETETVSPQRRTSTQFVPGILALDMGQTMSMKRPTRAHALAFFLPRAVVEAAIPYAGSLHGQVISCTSPPARRLRDPLQTMHQALPA